MKNPVQGTGKTSPYLFQITGEVSSPQTLILLGFSRGKIRKGLQPYNSNDVEMVGLLLMETTIRL
jgi:hypothetical protein